MKGRRPRWGAAGVAPGRISVLLSWQSYRKPGSDPRTGTETIAIRRRLHIDDQLPVKDEYRAMVTAAVTVPAVD